MKRWVVVLLILFIMHSTQLIFSGIGCSTLCTQETTITTIPVAPAREHGLLSAQRKQHPANKSKAQLQIEALKIAEKTRADDIRTPGLSKAEKEKRARLVREGAQLRSKELKEQSRARGPRPKKKKSKSHPTQGLRAAIGPDIVPIASQPEVPVLEA